MSFSVVLLFKSAHSLSVTCSEIPLSTPSLWCTHVQFLSFLQLEKIINKKLIIINPIFILFLFLCSYKDNWFFFIREFWYWSLFRKAWHQGKSDTKKEKTLRSLSLRSPKTSKIAQSSARDVPKKNKLHFLISF